MSLLLQKKSDILATTTVVQIQCEYVSSTKIWNGESNDNLDSHYTILKLLLQSSHLRRDTKSFTVAVGNSDSIMLVLLVLTVN